jgi:predicted extracellular nuclease
MKRTFQLVLPVVVVLAMFMSFVPTHSVQAVSTGIVISQVYGGGGNSGAIFKNDFIELYNLGSTPISVTGWTVQYASSTGSSWQKTVLSGTIPAGKYYLVQEAVGAGGTMNLPTPDATGTIPMSATAGKVALVSNITTLTVSCPTGLVDFVGFGAANCSETAPTPTLSNTTAALRKSNGAQDTDNNSADFIVGAPNPRNSLYPFAAIGLANPTAILPGEMSLLTVTVTPGTNPASTGITVTCNLGGIGGLSTQPFYDDGTNGDLTAGDNIFSFVTTDTAPGTQTLPCTFADGQGRAGITTISLTLLTVIPIGTVNGAVGDTDDATVHRSPYAPASGNGAGQLVTVQGVIYEKAIQPKSGGGGYYGFFIQNTAATRDSDPNTSDGLYVFMNTIPTIGTYTPTVGDEVVLTGTISEYYFMTELSNPVLAKPVLRSGVYLDTDLPPVVANPPVNLADANRYWERLQGMRVQVPANSIVLGGRNVFSPPDGEIWLARADSTVGMRTTAYQNRAFRDAHPLDDNYDPTVWDGNGYRMLMGSWGLKAAAGDPNFLIDPLRTFEVVTNAPVGGINYSFSKYRIEVTTQPTVSEGLDPAADNPPAELDRSINYSIVDYNLENLYDYRNNPFSGCDFPSDTAGCPLVAPFLAAVTSPYDYVPANDAVYQARLNDIANQIIYDLHSPDILMVQEVENQDICTVSGITLVCGTTDNADGKPDVLQELALKITSLGGPAYDAAFDRNSSDLRGIAPAFLFRTDRVELLPAVGDPILGGTPAIVYAGAGVPANSDVSNPKTLNAVLPAGITACETSWVFPRAPDIALFRIYSTSVGVGSHRDVYVINNHFKSGPDTCVAHRTEQAKYNAAIVQFIQSANPEARIVVGGDLNVYPRPDDIAFNASDQLGSLYDPSLGLKNLWEVLLGEHPESAYSYVYLGMAQTLDQMFISQSPLTDLKEFRIAHINSDFAADYPDDFARGTSDHDPNMATFIINDPPTVFAGGPYTVDEGSSITLTATGTDPENGPLTYAWDLNNDGTFETPGQSVTFLGINGPFIETVSVQVTDNGGLTAVASTTVTVNNVAPTASAGGPYTVDEGSSITLTATGTDPGNDPLTYAWDLNNDGTFETPGQSVTFLGVNGPSIETVSVQVTDDGGLSTIATTTVTVNNVAPTASAGGPYMVDEGSSITLTATGTDPGNDPLTYAWDLNNDGTFETPGQSVTFAGIDGPATLTVSVQVTDDGGLSTVDTTTITVNNIAPTLEPITGPTEPVAISLPVTISAAFTDPGILDTHTAVIEWGDGTTSAGSITEASGSGSVSGSHTYATPGIYTISMTVTDKDGGVSNTVTFENVVVYDAEAGFVTAGGWFISPVDAYKAKFEIDAKYHKDSIAPEGKTILTLTDTLLFNSIRYDWLVVSGNTAILKGTGTINDEGEYLFMVTMVDFSPDTIQIKIWDAGGVVHYDTLTGIVLGGGNISIKK